ncbi:odorant receptor 49b isoform X2 [Halyomorpha halys]|uniref:odorant receptor 49b isoform X2 n=1 Tax=Halyomorpha halys TaxID=286706 RepID=UPI0034D2AF56
MELYWNRKNLADVWTWPHIFWLNIFGWWGEEAKTEFGRKWLTRFRSLSIVYFACLITSMMIQVYIKFAEGDIMQNLFTIFASGPGMVGIFKFFDLVIHRKILKSIMGLISEVNDPILNTMTRKAFKKTWIIFLSTLLVFDSVVLHWALRPIIAAILHKEKTRIIESWPVFLDTWTQFFLSYLFQVPGVILLGHSFYIYDNLYFCTSDVILCHFEILKHKLNRLVLNENEKSSKDLVSCVKYHSAILSVCNDFRDATSKVIIWQSINTVIMLCTGIFILTYLGKNINSNALMNLGEVSFTLCTCLYYYCWFSNEITLQCTKVSNAVYMTNWISAKSSDKKIMLITMTRAMHPVMFGGIMQINLSTFINVLKTTFSFYNFLIAVQVSSTKNE